MLTVDLFSGAGGFALGFERAGWNIACANDFDANAAATFKANFPTAKFFLSSIADIRAVDLFDAVGCRRGEIDCIIGGPPCQSFSYNNHHRNATDERARLFEDYLRLVRETQPKIVVMENVPGLRTIDGGSVLEDIRTQFADLGYSVADSLLQAELYGTPQTRKRLIIAASRVGDAKDLIPVESHSLDLVSVQAAIADLPEVPNGFSQIKTAYGTEPQTEFQRRARQGSTELTYHVCTKLGPRNLSRIAHVRAGGNWRQIPRHLLPAGMQRAKLTDHTKRYGRLAWNGLASTILTKCDPHWGAYVHPSQNRTITVREAARLQGFPDTFMFANVGVTSLYQQIGNAVPVPLAEAIGNACTQHLMKRSVN